MQISLSDSIASLDEAIGQRGLAVVNMGDNAEVSNVFHLVRLTGNADDIADADP